MGVNYNLPITHGEFTNLVVFLSEVSFSTSNNLWVYALYICLMELIGDFNSPEKKLIGGYHPKMQLKIRKAYETIDQTSMKK